MGSIQDTTRDMSFAVELKFLVRYRREDLTDPAIRSFVPHLPAELRNSMTQSESRMWRDCWEAVAQTLDSIPNVDALTGHQIQEKGLGSTDYWNSHWIVYKSNSAMPLYVTFRNDDPYLPLLDTSHPDHDKYVWVPVEVCSPVLRWITSERDGASEEDGVLHILKNVLETINGGKIGAVFVNHSTETHVHVGRADGRLLSLATFKRLATLAWLSEPILRGVKNPASPNFEQVYTWSSPLRRHSRLAMALSAKEKETRTAYHKGKGGTVDNELFRMGDLQDFNGFVAGVNQAWTAKKATTIQSSRPENINEIFPELLESSDRQALEMIWRAPSHHDLGKMLSGAERQYRRLGFNFHSLEQDEEKTGLVAGPRTVEFRFLEGFIGTQVVHAWVRLCGELVALAVAPVESGEFYAVVAALLLTLVGDSPLDVKFRVFMESMGEDRISKSVWQPLQTVIRDNYPDLPGKATMHSVCT